MPYEPEAYGTADGDIICPDRYNSNQGKVCPMNRKLMVPLMVTSFALIAIVAISASSRNTNKKGEIHEHYHSTDDAA
jgi:hypothetical protein